LLLTAPCGFAILFITETPGIVLGIAILGIPGIVPGTGVARFTIVPGFGILGTPGIVPIGMARIITGIPGIGTAGPATARASITDLPVGITGPGGGGITALMQEDTAPVAVLSAPMSAA
jgi:hypothetical protein